MLEQFLTATDTERALAALGKLARHDVSRWALAGGFAIEMHCILHGCRASIRRLNDLDFIAAGFDCIPETLADDFLFRHVHPLDPPGKTILQLIDAGAALRIDVFRTCGAIMSRTAAVDLPSGRIQLISLEDAVARAARLVLDLGEGVSVSSKHAEDYLRLVGLADPSQIEAVWLDHRRTGQPMTFHETKGLLQELIPSRSNLLITPEYSKDVSEVLALRGRPSVPVGQG